MKTFLPGTGGNYTAAQSTPDGAILFAGMAQQGLPTTARVLQLNFGGSFYNNDPHAFSGGDAFLMRVSLSNPTPRIASIFPDSVFLGTGNNNGTWNFSLAGTGFAYGTQITFDGQNVASTFGSSSQITVTSLPAGAVQPGPNQIVASLAGPGGGASDPVTVTGYNPAPGRFPFRRRRFRRVHLKPRFRVAASRQRLFSAGTVRRAMLHLSLILRLK